MRPRLFGTVTTLDVVEVGGIAANAVVDNGGDDSAAAGATNGALSTDDFFAGVVVDIESGCVATG